jgi:hypothetical protein
VSTLTISIIALVVVVVGAVVLFNIWQARSSRPARRKGRDGEGRFGGFESRADGRVDEGEPPASRRWQPGPEQNAWARQRREPTLLGDDEAAASARLPVGEGPSAPDDSSDAPWPAGSYMSADDATEDAERARRAEPAQRPAGSRFDDDHWDAALLPDPDEELGPPQFETPRFDPASLEPAPQPAGRFAAPPPVPPPAARDTPHLAPTGFENTQPFQPGAPEPARVPFRNASAPAAARTAPGWRDGLQARPMPGAPAGSVAAGSPGEADPDATAEAGDAAPAAPPAAPQPAAIDLVVTLIPRAPVNAERLIALTSSLRHVGSKPVRIEIDGGQGRWVPLQSGAMVGCLRCSVLLANRQGALNAVELSDFSSAMESLAGQIGARFVPPDMNQVLRQARQLDAAAAKLDTQVDLGVEASAPITAQKLASVARQLDLFDRGSGRFACFAEGGELLYTLMPGETADMLAFVLDVPRTAQEHDPWRSMVACANRCAQLVGGRVVDGAGRGMSVSMIESVAQQLQRRYQELAQAGLKAGSPAALRLFN